MASPNGAFIPGEPAQPRSTIRSSVDTKTLWDHVSRRNRPLLKNDALQYLRFETIFGIQFPNGDDCIVLEDYVVWLDVRVNNTKRV